MPRVGAGGAGARRLLGRWWALSAQDRRTVWGNLSQAQRNLLEALLDWQQEPTYAPTWAEVGVRLGRTAHAIASSASRINHMVRRMLHRRASAKRAATIQKRRRAAGNAGGYVRGPGPPEAVAP